MTNEEFDALRPGDVVRFSYLIERYPSGHEKRGEAVVRIGEPVVIAGHRGYTCEDVRSRCASPFSHVFEDYCDGYTRVGEP